MREKGEVKNEERKRIGNKSGWRESVIVNIRILLT